MRQWCRPLLASLMVLPASAVVAGQRRGFLSFGTSGVSPNPPHDGQFNFARTLGAITAISLETR